MLLAVLTCTRCTPSALRGEQAAGLQAGVSSHSAGSTSRLAQQETLEAAIPCLHHTFGHCCSQRDHTDLTTVGEVG